MMVCVHFPRFQWSFRWFTTEIIKLKITNPDEEEKPQHKEEKGRGRRGPSEACEAVEGKVSSLYDD